MQPKKLICLNCKNFNEFSNGCRAFSEIPETIILGENDHSKPLPGQNNEIVFEPIEDGKE